MSLAGADGSSAWAVGSLAGADGSSAWGVGSLAGADGSSVGAVGPWSGGAGGGRSVGSGRSSIATVARAQAVGAAAFLCLWSLLLRSAIFASTSDCCFLCRASRSSLRAFFFAAR